MIFFMGGQFLAHALEAVKCFLLIFTETHQKRRRLAFTFLLSVHLLPLRQRQRKRLVAVRVRPASALLVLAFDERASRFVLNLRACIFAPAAFCRVIEMIGDALPVCQSFTIIDPSPVANAPPHILRQRN
jgi:hypothetical protein